MTVHIQMLQEIATHARDMADAMQAIVDDCTAQLAQRRADGEAPDTNPPQDDFVSYDEPTPFDDNPAAPEKPKLTIVELRAFVAERSTPENRAKIKAILGKYGVRKLTELKETQYEAVKNEVAAL
ncbi:MAG: hypothetical protein ACI4AL_05820 [Aristaeellaceae bacterium]